MIIIHAMTKQQILPRAIEPLIIKGLTSSPVVVITGCRQTGKSTLARGGLPGRNRDYITLDDLEIQARAQDDPDALIRRAPQITLDEVQRHPDLLLAVKRAVDEDRTPGRFILTGSADLALLRTVGETLAGRATCFTLHPMTRRELLGDATCGLWSEFFRAAHGDWEALISRQDLPETNWIDLVRRGGYPTPAYDLESDDERQLWFTGYVRTYLERDLRQIRDVASLVDFRRLMRAACLRIGNLINQTELGRDVGLSQPTVSRHLDALEASYLLVRIAPYSVNRTKRLIKSPKLYWMDAGLCLHLSGEAEPRGAHLENLVLIDLMAWRESQLQRPEVLYWRTTAGDEVDFVVEWNGRLLPIEIKATTRPKVRDTRSIRIFREEYGNAALPGLLLHAGTETSWIRSDVLAVPWWRVF